MSGSIPWLIVRLPCGSRSTQRTRWPDSESATARFRVVVVFATPPFWLAKANTFIVRSRRRLASGSGAKGCVRFRVGPIISSAERRPSSSSAVGGALDGAAQLLLVEASGVGAGARGARRRAPAPARARPSGSAAVLELGELRGDRLLAPARRRGRSSRSPSGDVGASPARRGRRASSSAPRCRRRRSALAGSLVPRACRPS